MKENTKQILKVSICTLVALALFVGVILMCIYFAFDNTTSGVARAEETSSQELLFDDECIVDVDKFSQYSFTNNCIYVNSSFDFNLLEDSIRNLIVDNFDYGDIFIYRIAEIFSEESGVYQYFYFAYWQNDCNLILSTDEYLERIREGVILDSYNSYSQFYEDYLNEFTVWYIDLFIDETVFTVGDIHHFLNYQSQYSGNLSINTLADVYEIFDSYINSIINTSSYFVDDSHDGVLYVPISENSDLTINPYYLRTDDWDLCSFINDFNFSSYSPTYNDSEDFYSLVDCVYNGLDFSFGFSLSAGSFAYLYDGDFYFLTSDSTVGPFALTSYSWLDDGLRMYRFDIIDIKPLYYDIQHYLNYELEDGYCSDLGLVVSSSWGYLTSSYIYGYSGGYDDGHTSGYVTGYDDGLAHYLPLIQSLQQEKTQLQQQITSLQEEKTTLQNEITTLQEQNTALNNQISALREHIDDLYSTINILTSDRDSLRQQVSELQNQITSLQQEKTQLQQQITTLQEEKTTLQNEITTLQEQNTALQNQITELQSELDRYESYYESIGWFDVLSSSLNNVSLINIDGYKSTYVDVNVADGTNNQVNVWNLDENPGNGTAFAVVLPRYFGNGTRFRFSYRGLIGSASGMADLPAFLGYINSTGNLITIMELPVSSETFVEFNISEEINTFVIYSTGNLIVFEDFKFQIFSFDEIGIYDDGFADGRDEGIKYGETVGYENGYADARDYYMNNDFSFFALFSSVLDAPLQMIIGTDEKPGMLNFYIPGLDINIAPFLLSLFSVALVITIIRFILARAS